MNSQASQAAESSTCDVAIIIVTFHTRDITCACLQSIYGYPHECEYEVIVIDNGSNDGSSEMIARQFSKVQLIVNRDNKGFAAANNQGMKIARGRYLLLLNSDTEVNAETLKSTLDFADHNPDIAVIGCRAFDKAGTQQSTLFRGIRLQDVALNVLIPNNLIRRSNILARRRYPGINLDLVQQVEVVAGCFMFVRRQAWEQVGPMYEGFFMYGEEADWCFRFRRAGWRVSYFPGARILHHGNVSSAKCPDEMSVEMAKSQLLLLQRTQGRVVACIANVLMLLRDLPRAIFWRIVSRMSKPRSIQLRQALRRSSERCSLHARGLLRTDWGA